MPYVRKLRRRTPSDKQLMRPLSDPGVGKAIALGAVLLGVLGFGLMLVLRGLS